MLELIGEIGCEPCPSVGMGEDWRFEDDDIVGQILVVEGFCIHMSAFPNEARNRGERQDSDIMLPSRQGHRRNSPLTLPVDKISVSVMATSSCVRGHIGMGEPVERRTIVWLINVFVALLRPTV